MRTGRGMVAGVGGLVLTVLIGGGAYWAGSHTSPTADEGEVDAAPSPSTSPPPAVPQPRLDTPEAAAADWLRTRHGLRATDDRPDAWVDRLAPLVTGQAQAATAQVRGGSGGADWQQLQAGGCRQQVAGVSAVVPPEAPSTPDTVYVQVVGTVEQHCTRAAGRAPRPVAATVATTRGEDGRWRISAQLH